MVYVPRLVSFRSFQEQRVIPPWASIEQAQRDAGGEVAVDIAATDDESVVAVVAAKNIGLNEGGV
jgi:hypothetical protein